MIVNITTRDLSTGHMTLEWVNGAVIVLSVVHRVVLKQSPRSSQDQALQMAGANDIVTIAANCHTET